MPAQTLSGTAEAVFGGVHLIDATDHTADRQSGVVKWFETTKGFGFVQPEGVLPSDGADDAAAAPTIREHVLLARQVGAIDDGVSFETPDIGITEFGF